MHIATDSFWPWNVILFSPTARHIDVSSLNQCFCFTVFYRWPGLTPKTSLQDAYRHISKVPWRCSLQYVFFYQWSLQTQSAIGIFAGIPLMSRGSLCAWDLLTHGPAQHIEPYTQSVEVSTQCFKERIRNWDCVLEVRLGLLILQRAPNLLLLEHQLPVI